MGSLFKKKKAAATPPQQIPPELFKELCQDGERADVLIGQSLSEKGQEVLGTIFARMLEAGVVDEFILAKLCLSQIQGAIVSNKIETAFAIWTGKLPGPPGQFYAAGINAIETGILDLRDTLIYQATGAFLHACNTDIEAGRQAVNAVMVSVLDGAGEHLSEHRRQLVAHWKYCLTRLYDDDPEPSELYDPLKAKVKELELELPEKGKLAIIRPSPWKTNSKAF